MKKVTPEQFITSVREMVAERPDFNYRGQGVEPKTCSYLGRQLSEPDEGEACLFGQLFAKLGLTRKELKRHEGDNAASVATLVTTEPLTDEQSQWVGAIQQRQDGGHTWAKAQSWADEFLRTV